MLSSIAGLLRLIPWRAIVLFVAGGIATAFYFGTYVGRVEPPEERLAEVADRAVEQLVERLPRERLASRVLVLPFAGDHTRYLRDALARRIAASGKYAVINLGPLGERLRDLGIDLPAPATRAAALRMAVVLPGERVVWGRLEEWRADETGAHATLNATLLDPATGATVWSDTVRASTLPVIGAGRGTGERVAQASALLFGWAAATDLLPLLLWPVTRRVLERRDNLANLALVAGVTAASVAGAWWIGRSVASGWVLAAVVAIAVPGAAWIAVRRCEWMDSLHRA